MKKTLLAVVAVAFAANVNAQITLNSGSYPSSVIGTDSLKATTAATVFPSLVAMPNGSWDLSTVTDSTPVLYVYRVPATSYQFADSNFYSFSTYAYQGNVQSAITSTALLEYGINVQQAAYSLPTGGSADSIIFPTQNIPYSGPRKKIAFPATYETAWSSVYNFDFIFDISVALASLSHAPGIVRTYISETDSVTGWGKMRVKDITGGASDWFSVLQVKTVTTSVDSFFINSLPASPTLLSVLGLTQGQITKTYEQNYYRPMEVTAFANVQFSDSTYSTPTKATTHTQRLANTGLLSMGNAQAVSVYPNPAVGSTVFVELPAIGGTWSYELINMNGQVMANGILQMTGTRGNITLPPSFSPGVYAIRLSIDGKQYCVKPIAVTR